MSGTRGFTLVEILVVLAILGITAAAVVPALARVTDEDGATRTARALEHVLMTARTTALERARLVDLTLVTEQGRWRMRFRDGTALDSGTIELEEGSRILGTVPRPTFRFAPNGVVDGDSLLVLGPGGARALVVDRWSGGIRVEPR